MDAKQAAQASLQKQVDNNTVNDTNTEATDVSKALDSLLPKMAEASLRGMRPEFLRSSALALLRSNDYLRKNCDIPSILHGVLQAALLGLRLDPALGQACLVPRKGKAQFMPMYKGLVLLAHRSGKVVDVVAQVVYEKDEFTIRYGSHRALDHVPAKGDRGKPLGAYGFISTTNGGQFFEYLTQAEIEKIRDKGGYDPGKPSPWKTDAGAMWEKTAIKQALRLVPTDDPALSTAVALDDLEARGVDQRLRIEDGALAHAAPAEADPEIPGDAREETNRLLAAAGVNHGAAVEGASAVPVVQPAATLRAVVAEILSRFKGVTVRYEFKETAESHLIEVTPLDVFRSEEFKKFARTKVREFYGRFPGTNFTFISDESLARITNPEIEESNQEFVFAQLPPMPAPSAKPKQDPALMELLGAEPLSSDPAQLSLADQAPPPMTRGLIETDAERETREKMEAYNSMSASAPAQEHGPQPRPVENWPDLCLSVVGGAMKNKPDKARKLAGEWYAAAQTRLKSKNINQAEFDKVDKQFRVWFPPKPIVAEQLSLLDAKPAPTPAPPPIAAPSETPAPKKTEPLVQPGAGIKATKVPKDSDKETEVYEQFAAEIAAADKIPAILAVKSKIASSSMLGDSAKKGLGQIAQDRFAQIKAGKR